ncbi:hypothetical protein C1N80_02845 [Brachybacterium sp. SGAir0954]|uniref:hypothetical protein n=1 Tax=Brachybacterium sp. SGAir0954 TaxID=2571029 RepID=UPI0010CD65F5|nr:hypothetical protein [Brachybacterium sp. SGAir0954]QCR52626.1 hypothetical protein C1N80_02845 [Brachybacterium sp. SGAir0954]
MSPRPALRRVHGLSSRLPNFLGIPVVVILAVLVVAALIGLQLSTALEQSSTTHPRAGVAVDTENGAGKNSAGLPVVTESSLGTEVQRLVDAGTIQPMTSFDAATCLQTLGSADAVLIMEEVAWGTDQTSAWLLVHGPVDRDTLQATGGTVSVTVVRPTCGDASTQADPSQVGLWSGTVLIEGV